MLNPKQKSLKHKLVLLALSVSLVSCGKFAWAPEPPAVDQCAWSVKFQAFYCVNTKTGAKTKIPGTDPRMDKAQALSAKDYNRSEKWANKVKTLAEDHCE